MGNDIAAIDPQLLRISLVIGTVFVIIAFLTSFKIRDSKALSVEEEGSVASVFEQNQIATGWKDVFAPNALKVVGITLVSGLFIGFGAGTSVPYFPRFFFDIYYIDLSNLSLIFGVLTILTATWGKINSNLGDRYGRVKMIVVNQMLAVILLYILATYPPIGFALLALIVRNAVMNATGPLNTAILMEFTPRRFRSITSSLTQIGWSLFFGFGQIFGGRLVDNIGFRIPFTITATLYLIATFLYLIIGRYDPKVKEPISSIA